MSMDPETAEPYVLLDGEGETALWYSARVTMKASTPHLGVSVCDIEAGDEPPLHAHTREHEWFYVIAGEVSFQFPTGDVRAPAGSFVSVPPEVPHTLSIESDTSRLLVLNAPGGEERMFQLSPADAEDMARMFAEYGLRLLGPHPRDAA